MSKKSRTTVPDFSSKKPKSKTPLPSSGAANNKPSPVAAPRVKPQATSAKSGRRGG